MVKDAEKYKKEDEGAAARITARNSSESYMYNLRNMLKDEKVADKIDVEDKAKLETAVEEATKWLESSQEAPKEEYEEKQKESEDIAGPIMTKFFQTANAGDAGGSLVVRADSPAVHLASSLEAHLLALAVRMARMSRAS